MMLGFLGMQSTVPRRNQYLQCLPVGAAKYRAGTGPELTESSGEFPDVVKSVGEAWPPGLAKYSATSISESELVELISSAVVKSVGGARPGTSPPRL